MAYPSVFLLKPLLGCHTSLLRFLYCAWFPNVGLSWFKTFRKSVRKLMNKNSSCFTLIYQCNLTSLFCCNALFSAIFTKCYKNTWKLTSNSLRTAELLTTLIRYSFVFRRSSKVLNGKTCTRTAKEETSVAE